MRPCVDCDFALSVQGENTETILQNMCFRAAKTVLMHGSHSTGMNRTYIKCLRIVDHYYLLIIYCRPPRKMKGKEPKKRGICCRIFCCCCRGKKKEEIDDDVEKISMNSEDDTEINVGSTSKVDQLVEKYELKMLEVA